MRDVIIIGKGPAGISCAIYLKRANLNPLVLGYSYGCLEKDTIIENYYGFSKITGKELVQRGIDHAKSFNIEVESEEVIKIIDNFDSFTVITKNNSYDAKVVVIATGKKRLDLKIKNYQNFLGKGISFCATCDGFFFRNKKIGVVGNGSYALSELEELENFSKELTLFTNDDIIIENNLRENINIINSKIEKVDGIDKLQSITLTDGRKIDIDALFIALGVSSGADFARHLGVVIDDTTQSIKVDHNYMTSINGIFAIGDCIGGTYQVAKAVSDGCIASKSIIKYIKKEGNL